MTKNHQPTLLVTGASGHMGRRVVELLLEAQAGTIIAATRSPEKLADFSQQGVIVRHADFNDPASLAKAFAGVDRLLLISTDALGEPGLRLRQHQTAVKAAQDAGVSHVVYTSLINPEPDSPVLIAPDHYGTEMALAASTLNYTVLRNNIYTEVLIPTLSQAAQTGQLFSAAGEGKTAYVTREDCARAAAAALASSFNGRRTLNITSPEALSRADLAALAAQITGKPVTYIPLEPEAMIQGMVSAGLPHFVAEMLASFDTGIAQDKFSAVSNAVQELTGRQPMRIADFLSAQKSALLPTPTQ
ncbi:MAG TPA: SDR family oxidoreductase [Chloroflexota bacterium]|nr:SDR family oxidoreductase [Chloroflexota bacterium]HUM70081.1 SDR family oxidoreductase [Chloroflexota bacterium]